VIALTSVMVIFAAFAAGMGVYAAALTLWPSVLAPRCSLLAPVLLLRCGLVGGYRGLGMSDKQRLAADLRRISRRLPETSWPSIDRTGSVAYLFWWRILWFLRYEAVYHCAVAARVGGGRPAFSASSAAAL
jgi:hypothetical protein